MTTVQRLTVDLSGYPDLVVIYLGMRVRTWTGIKTLFGFGPKIQGSVAEQPDGLLLHENMLFSLFPPHAGMRQYWRDFDALERWSRSEPHKLWWQQFVKDSGGTGFWHETYFVRGGFEAVYLDVYKNIGFAAFAPTQPAHGAMFSARRRLRLAEDKPDIPAAPVAETDLTQV
ncbi:MAG TPA: phenylacetaldoxime dehydratase family protein [Candidatus Acidoferrales bacterium]|nr:phenylacetaldoxime dehydratase family protein [Candidatus Acidoferrales bacterium]